MTWVGPPRSTTRWARALRRRSTTCRLRSSSSRWVAVRRGGTVEKFIGDAVMALFGAPVAREDDPERAVRAALAIRDWIAEEGRLEVRIAVNTGEALVDLDAKPEAGQGMAAGDVVNTTARMQSAAPVNGILAGETTQRATAETIDYRDHEPVEAKGKQAPIPVWEVVQARARFGVDLAPQEQTPLVGRAREVEQVLDEDTEWDLSHLRPLVGEASAAPGSQEEAFAAWRRFWEALAEQYPLVLVFEDVQWADDGLLDFVDQLADWVRDVPMLIVCTARLELLERRPAWGGGKVNAATVALAPLSDGETAKLISSLSEHPLLAAETQSALLDRAGGN